MKIAGIFTYVVLLLKILGRNMETVGYIAQMCKKSGVLYFSSIQ